MNLISRSIKYIKIERAWQKKYNRLAPVKGDLAPDFELFDIEGKESVRLSDFQGDKPVVLIFGSYT
ncbi:MAG: redoxin domain-containing protein [Desulfobacterales bacterium]|jgi:hypothetical protein|nr:redoxin domain-containing protein [Desulfobacteraceae bacterium]MBT7085611.1 redoxin domain-containing protein [Desulfobacterales bacterium]MBT7696489.1 redoxin domain-containing protein [Desulfobacterales bacterium]